MKKATRILMVDDDPAIHQIYPEFLRAAGYEVEEVATGEEGLQATRERQPDLVLLDVKMPGIGGIEVCRQIKADPALADVFVVLFSGSAAGAAEKIEGLETGADDYLAKSLEPREFLARIRTILRLRDTTAALRASEKRFRQFAENIREVFWMTDFTKNEMMYISPGYEEIWGRTCESLYASPWNWMEAIHPDDRERVLDAALTKQVSGRYDEVYRILRPDGSERWIQDRAFPIRDESGKVYRIVGIAEDVTSRKQWEDALRASEARKAAIMEAALDAIVTIDRQGRIVEFNSAAEKTFGCTRSQAIGRQMAGVLIAPSVREWFQHGLAHSFSTDEGSVLGMRVETAACRADGTEFPIEFTIARIELPESPMLTAFIRDISGRKRAEGQLTMLAHAVESTTEPITITDLQNRFTFVNRAFQKAYGFTEREVLGKTPEILFSPRNPPSLLPEILERTRSGGWRGEVLDRRKDGTEFPILLSTSEVKDNAGRVIGLMGVAQDITERRRAEERIRLLADAVQSTQDLISVTDHENRLTFVNQAFLKAYGYNEVEVLGRKPDFLYSGKNPPGLCERVFQATLAEGWTGEIINCKKDGTEFPVSLQTSQIKNNRGEVIGLVGTARDISERKRTERQNATFSALGHLLSAANTPEQAANIILGIASELFGWHAGYVHLYSPEQDKILPVLTMDTIEGERQQVAATTFTLTPSQLMREVMRQGPRLIDRGDGSVAAELVPFGDTQRPSASMMYVPIQSGGTVLGILSIQSYMPGAYSKKDLTLLQALADSCGGAVQRIRMTEAVREAETRYRGIFENATEGIFQTTAQGRYLHANPALARMFGYDSPAELISSVTNIEQQTFVSSETARELKRLLEAQDHAVGFEAERFRKDGTRYWTSINVRAARDATGALECFEGTVQDITTRKRAEKQRLSFSRLGYRLSVAVAPEQAANIILEIASEIFGWDAGYMHLYSEVEDQILRVLTLDTIEGQRVPAPPARSTNDPTPLMRQVMQEGARLINRGSEPTEAEDRFPFGDTQRRSAAMMYVPIRSSGSVVGILSIQSYIPQAYSQEDLVLLQALADNCGDTLRRIEVTEALRQAEAKYRSIFENATEGIFRTTPEGRILSANPALARMFGYESSEGLISGVANVGRQVYVWLEKRHELKHLLETKGSVDGFEAEGHHKDGSKFWSSINARAVHDASGALLYYEGTIQDITERKHAESVLRRSEERFRTLFESSHIGIGLHDANGRFVHTNSAYQRLLGYSEEELRRLGVKRVTLPDDVAEGQRLFEELREGKRDHYQREKRYLRRDGQIVWAQSSASAIRNGNGQLQYIISMVEDITDRRQAQKALRQSERKLRLIAENTSDVIFAFDMERRPIYINPAVKELTGYTFDEIQEKKFINWIHPVDQKRMLQLWEELFAGKGYSEVEFRLLTKGGQTKWCSSTWGSLLDENGHQIGVQGRERDITELRRADAARRELVAIVENSSSAIISVGQDGLVISWNKAAERIFGYTAQELIGQHFSILFPPSRPDEFTEALPDLLQGRRIDGFETLHRRKDGSLVEVLLTISPIRDAAGKFSGASAIAQDITERKQLEKELLEISAKERRRVGHELHDGLGQHLTGIALKTKALEEYLTAEGSAHDEKAKGLVKLMNEAIRMTRNLAHGLDPVHVEANGLVAALAKLASQTEDLFHVQCVFACKQERLDANAQTGLALYRITQEAIHNAVIHGQARRLQVELALDESHLSVTIQDNGKGFTAKSQPAAGLGLRTMRYRANSIGATLMTHSDAKTGTRIECLVPKKLCLAESSP